MPITISGSTGIAGVDGTASSPALQGADTNTGMFFPAADTIAFAEGGVEVMRIDSSGNLLFNSGYGSVATAYGCRAWVSFDGTTASPSTRRGSGNVSSVTKNGTGDFTINFTNALTDANYSVVATVGDSSNTTLNNRAATANPVNSSSVRVETFVATTAALIDNNSISVAVFR